MIQTLKYKNGVLPPDEEIETFIALREAFPKLKIRRSERRMVGHDRGARRAQAARIRC